MQCLEEEKKKIASNYPQISVAHMLLEAQGIA